MIRALRRAAMTETAVGRLIRLVYGWVVTFSVPAPVMVVKPVLTVFVTIRALWYFCYRVLVCEPLFKAYCHEYGKGLHTGCFVHWVMGRGRLVIGQNVLLDGKCSFVFASRRS